MPGRLLQNGTHRDNLLRFAELFREAGGPAELYVVGGAVRDAIRGRPISDVDFATNVKPDGIKHILRDMEHVFEVGERFGTIGCVIDGEKYEFTTYRTEEYTDGTRHPEVDFCDSIHLDLARRDFTMNAMALDLLPDYRPVDQEFLDPYGGAEDIESQTIRAVGNPKERFSEDPLRMMRAIRFFSQTGFIIEGKTWGALSTSSMALTRISVERIQEELMKTLEGPWRSTAVYLLVDSGLAQCFLPELYPMINMGQPAKWHTHDVFTHTLRAVRFSQEDSAIMALAALLHDVGKPKAQVFNETGVHFYDHHKIGAEMADDIMKRLKFSTDEIRFVKHLVLKHMVPHQCKKSYNGVRRMVNRHQLVVDNEIVVSGEHLLRLAVADAQASGFKDTGVYDEMFYHYNQILEADENVIVCPVDGNVIMSHFGLSPGPEVGQLKEMVVEAILNGELDADVPAEEALDYLAEVSHEDNI